MRRSTAWRTLISVSLALSLTANVTSSSGHAATSPPRPSSRPAHDTLSLAEVQRLSKNADQRVIVILRDPYHSLPNQGTTRAARAAAIATTQRPILGELAQLHAPGVHAYRLINAVAATVSTAEAQRLKANSLVQAVVPDRLIRAPHHAREGASPPTAPAPDSVLPTCALSPTLEPEALQLTNTAFADSTAPQAQSIVSGTGVTVAFLADGLDITNPDFLRPDGTPVFVDYQDFTGDGPNAPTSGGEAFGDASSIAAQGNETYDVNAWVTPTHRRSVACPQIKILGMAPGASLMGLKVIGRAGVGYTSQVVQAIQYAVSHGANVINESFGANAYPDNANDPISLANAAATAAGITVVASTGDAGTASTIASPATDPTVISAGATTQFRFYQQIGFSGFQLSNGQYTSNNISALSSAGPSQLGNQTVDVVAPGDLSWEACTPNTALYAACSDANGNPASFTSFGGTSEAAPLTAGAAALVIQAYRQTHGGASPSPALVKQIIMSSATDLNTPSYEQGAGLINSLAAVRLAASYHDANGSPVAIAGAGLVVSPTVLAATAAPSTPTTFSVQVTNADAVAHTVAPRVRTLGAPFNHQAFTPVLDPTTNPTFIDANGLTRAYVAQQFTVPNGTDRLDAAISFDVTQDITAIVRMALLDPQGRYTAYTLPQDALPPFATSGYGHVDVHNAAAGTWTALIFTRANPAGFGYYAGPVHLDIAASRFETAGSSSPTSRMLAPGETATFQVATSTPPQPGNESADVVVDQSDPASGAHTGSSVIPLILRSTVPLGPTGGAFSGLLTGGNGRGFSPGQISTYEFDVPAGLHDLDLGLAITDTNYNLQGTLVDPNGLPLDVQSTVTSLVTETASLFLGQPDAYANTLQFFRRDPQAGRWKLVLIINDNISGRQTALPFTATIVFNGVQVQAAGVPNDASVTLRQGQRMMASLTVTNTGNTTKDFFVDPRLAQTTQYALPAVRGSSFTVPLTATFPLTPAEAIPTFFVPPESTEVSVAAESMSPTVPISMDLSNNNGAPPYGSSGSPDSEATSFLDPFTSRYAAVASIAAPEVPPGFWVTLPTEVGPFPGPAISTTVQLGAMATAQQFDAAARPSTGNPVARLLGQSTCPYTPLTLAPGQTGPITVTITPDAAAGTVIHGFLYVDAVNANSRTFGSITGSGDEVIAIPYAYTVDAAPTTTTTTRTRLPPPRVRALAGDRASRQRGASSSRWPMPCCFRPAP